MAKANKLTPASPPVSTSLVEAGVSPKDLRATIDEAARQKLLAQEYNGNVSQIVRSAIDRLSLNKAALTFARKLDAMEAQDRDATISAVIEYMNKLGHFDQPDLFSPGLAHMQDVIARAQAQKPDRAAKVAPELAAMTH